MASPADIQAATAAVAAGTQTAEQAALVNQSYLSNSLPVLPAVAPNASAQDYGQYSQYQREQVYNSNQQNNLILTWNTQGLSDPANQQGKAVYLTPTEYQQQYGATDAQREQIRYNIFNNPAAVNPNTVPADMQGLYGTQLRDQQSDYYRANPSAEFQRITQQYEANRYGSVGSGSNYTYNYGSSKNPFDPNSAAGIAWLVGRQGGNITESMRERGAEDYFFQTGGMISPTDFGAMVGVGVVSGISTVPTRSTGSGPVAGMSAGSQFVDDVDIYMAVGGYQGVRVPDAKLAIDYQTGEFGVYQKMGTHNVYGLVGGGGWNSLQSGMFSFGESLWDKEHTFAQSDIGSMAPVSSEYMSTHSKAGAEAYGGFSRLLTGNLLQPDDAISRYGNWNNLANYVQPVAATKGAVKGADIPWTMDVNAPAAQYMDWSGLTGQTFDVSMPTDEFQKTFDTSTPGRTRGGWAMASVATLTGDAGAGIEGLPKPFVSTSSPATAQDTQGFSKYDQSVFGGYSGGLIGYYLWGEKSPEVIKGAFGSGVDFITGMVGWTPAADAMRTEAPGLQEFRTEKTSRETSLTAMYSEGSAAYGVDESGKIKIDITNPAAVAFQQRYEGERTGYSTFMESSKEKGFTIYSKGQLIENPELTYNYGEFTKWGAGAGAQVRNYLGYNMAQLEDYGTQLEQKKGIEYIPEKIVYGTGYTLSTHPEKFISAYIGGAIMVTGGAIIEGTAAASGVTAAAGAWAAAHPTAAAAASVFTRYGIPLAFAGATYYGASEGFTATPERTTINVGKMGPELAGVMYGGATAYVGLRAIDAGWAGFKTTEIKADVFEGEQPKIIPKLQEIQRSGVLKFGEPERGYIFDLQSGELKATITGTRGSVNPYPALSDLPEGGRYGVYHTHTKTPGFFDIVKENIDLARSGEISPGEAAAYTYDFMINRPKYIAGGGLPSHIDIVTSRGVTSEFKAHFGIHSGVVEEGVISPGGINIYTRNRVTRPMSEIYETPEAMGRAFINSKIPEEDLFSGYSSGRREVKASGNKKVEFSPGYEANIVDLAKAPLPEYPRGTMESPANLPYDLRTPVRAEPTIELGGARVRISELSTTESAIPQYPMSDLPGIRGVFEGAEMGDTAIETSIGFRGLGKSKTSSAYSTQKMFEDFSFYTQKPSPKTTLLREQQASLWAEPPKTGIMPMDMLPGAGKLGGFKGESVGIPSTIEPFPGELPKGFGLSTDKGFGYGGAPMSEQMLEAVVTQGPIRSTGFTDIGSTIEQTAAAARVRPAVKSAEAQGIIPSATKATFENTPSMTGFGDIFAGILESEKRPASAATSQKFPKGMQIDYLRGALKKIPIDLPRAIEGPVELEPTRFEFETNNRNVNGKIYDSFFSNQWNTQPGSQSVSWKQWSPTATNTKTATKTTQLPASISAQTPVQMTSQLPSQASVSVTSQLQVQTPIPVSHQMPYQTGNVGNTPATRRLVGQTPGTQPATRQMQDPFAVQISPSATILDTLLVPATVLVSQTRPFNGRPFAPTFPTPYVPTPETPWRGTTYPEVPPPPPPPPKGGHWVHGWETDIPRIPPVGLPWGGSGGESPFSRKRKAAFVETFNMGLDMAFLGRKGRASKSFTTPAKYKRKPASAKPAAKPAKKAASKKRK